MTPEDSHNNRPLIDSPGDQLAPAATPDPAGRDLSRSACPPPRELASLLKQVNHELALSNRRLTTANRRLEMRHRELEEFFCTASHNLKAPLIAIQGFARLLSNELSPATGGPVALYLERITKNVYAMETQLQDLLSLHRAGSLLEEVRTIVMRDMVAAVTADFAVVAGDKGITLRVVPPLPDVVGRPNRIQELLANLVDNAIKYLPPGSDGLVEIGHTSDLISPVGERGAFFVRDNGRGIPLEFQIKIFEIFDRGAQAKGPGAGSGVGLAIAERIVKSHGGAIWLESTQGEGATFCFSLPLAKTEMTERRSSD